MSAKERDRLRVLHELAKERLRLKDAARLLRISRRQVRRLVNRYEAEGDAGLVHRLRNRPSNRRIWPEVRKKAVERIKERYGDFGPTLASEELKKRDGIAVSKETVRKWMVEEGVWEARRRRVRHRQWRERKASRGELVQMDTSIHDWLEGRGEEVVLIAMIDDATSEVFARFWKADTTASNLAVLRAYLKRYGRPRAIYADKASHFQTTRRADVDEALRGREAETQIQRALRELEIEYIAAHSPQAKGRIERFFKTAQDRLVKEMRLEGICDMESGNRYLESTFLPEWRRDFTVKASCAVDAHRPLEGFDLKAILSPQTTRAVANDYTIQYRRRLLQIDRREVRVGLRRSRVTIEEWLDGSVKLRWRGRYLRYKEVGQRREADGKGERNEALTPVGLRPPSVRASKKSQTPRPDHPWRKGTFLLCSR